MKYMNLSARAPGKPLLPTKQLPAKDTGDKSKDHLVCLPTPSPKLQNAANRGKPKFYKADGCKSEFYPRAGLR